MKSLLKNALLITLLTVLVFQSCTKKNPRTTTVVIPSPPPPPPPSLSGLEFLFDSLTWIFYDGSFDVGVDDIYLKTPPKADLFPWLTYSTNINAHVFIKFDTTANWVDVNSLALYVPSPSVQYLYWINLNSLFVDVRPLNYQLIGRKATIKIKFL